MALILSDLFLRLSSQHLLNMQVRPGNYTVTPPPPKLFHFLSVSLRRLHLVSVTKVPPTARCVSEIWADIPLTSSRQKNNRIQSSN